MSSQNQKKKNAIELTLLAVLQNIPRMVIPRGSEIQEEEEEFIKETQMVQDKLAEELIDRQFLSGRNSQ